MECRQGAEGLRRRNHIQLSHKGMRGGGCQPWWKAELEYYSMRSRALESRAQRDQRKPFGGRGPGWEVDMETGESWMINTEEFGLKSVA